MLVSTQITSLKVLIVTWAIDTDYVPVYPLMQPPAFSPSPPQPMPINPFGVRQIPTRTAPARRSKFAHIAPKGNRLPPVAPVETYEGGDPNSGRGRKRPLSPDSRAAAREVRLIRACARCAKKREKVGLLPLRIKLTILTDVSVESSDHVGPVKVKTKGA